MNPLDKGKQMPCLRHVLNIFLLDIFSMIVRSPKLIENCQKRGHQYAKHCMHVMKKNLLTNYSAVLFIVNYTLAFIFLLWQIYNVYYSVQFKTVGYPWEKTIHLVFNFIDIFENEKFRTKRTFWNTHTTFSSPVSFQSCLSLRIH